jgi:hypothetical protein
MPPFPYAQAAASVVDGPECLSNPVSNAGRRGATDYRQCHQPSQAESSLRDGKRALTPGVLDQHPGYSLQLCDLAGELKYAGGRRIVGTEVDH